jgi:hypothetical protein
MKPPLYEQRLDHIVQAVTRLYHSNHGSNAAAVIDLQVVKSDLIIVSATCTNRAAAAAKAAAAAAAARPAHISVSVPPEQASAPESNTSPAAGLASNNSRINASSCHINQ